MQSSLNAALGALGISSQDLKGMLSPMPLDVFKTCCNKDNVISDPKTVGFPF